MNKNQQKQKKNQNLDRQKRANSSHQKLQTPVQKTSNSKGNVQQNKIPKSNKQLNNNNEKKNNLDINNNSSNNNTNNSNSGNNRYSSPINAKFLENIQSAVERTEKQLGKKIDFNFDNGTLKEELYQQLNSQSTKNSSMQKVDHFEKKNNNNNSNIEIPQKNLAASDLVTPTEENKNYIKQFKIHKNQRKKNKIPAGGSNLVAVTENNQESPSEDETFNVVKNLSSSNTPKNINNNINNFEKNSSKNNNIIQRNGNNISNNLNSKNQKLGSQFKLPNINQNQQQQNNHHNHRITKNELTDMQLQINALPKILEDVNSNIKSCENQVKKNMQKNVKQDVQEKVIGEFQQMDFKVTFFDKTQQQQQLQSMKFNNKNSQNNNNNNIQNTINTQSIASNSNNNSINNNKSLLSQNHSTTIDSLNQSKNYTKSSNKKPPIQNSSNFSNQSQNQKKKPIIVGKGNFNKNINGNNNNGMFRQNSSPLKPMRSPSLNCIMEQSEIERKSGQNNFNINKPKKVNINNNKISDNLRKKNNTSLVLNSEDIQQQSKENVNILNYSDLNIKQQQQKNKFISEVQQQNYEIPTSNKNSSNNSKQHKPRNFSACPSLYSQKNNQNTGSNQNISSDIYKKHEVLLKKRQQDNLDVNNNNQNKAYDKYFDDLNVMQNKNINARQNLLDIQKQMLDLDMKRDMQKMNIKI